MVTWIIERDVFAVSAYEQMCQAVKELGHTLRTVTVLPFVHEILGKPPVVEGPVIVYGSIGVETLAKRYGWTPGVFTDPETFNYDTYRNALGDLILNPDAKIMRLSEVMDQTSGMEEFFIKPNDDNKAFAGQLMKRLEFEEWLVKLRDMNYLDESDLEVALSSPKELAMEWRSIVVNGEIIESSIYRQWQRVMPERNRDPDVDALILEAHRRFQPAPVYVIDVAQTRDGLKVVEYNTFNSAGTYACDIHNIVDAVSRYVEQASSIDFKAELAKLG